MESEEERKIEKAVDTMRKAVTSEMRQASFDSYLISFMMGVMGVPALMSGGLGIVSGVIMLICSLVNFFHGNHRRMLYKILSRSK